jgi:C4-dicarboxylate-specific signal transduction histidine kinase
MVRKLGCLFGHIPVRPHNPTTVTMLKTAITTLQDDDYHVRILFASVHFLRFFFFLFTLLCCSVLEEKHARMHTLMHARVYTHTHTHTHTHTPQHNTTHTHNTTRHNTTQHTHTHTHHLLIAVSQIQNVIACMCLYMSITGRKCSVC